MNINNDDLQRDNSNSKLSINKSEADEVCDDLFTFDNGVDNEDVHYAKDNLNLISNTLEKEISNNAINDSNKSTVNCRMINILKNIKNEISKIGNSFEKDLNEKKSMYTKIIEMVSSLCDLYKNVKQSLVTNNYDIFAFINNGIDNIIEMYASDGKMNQLLKTEAAINMIKLLKFIKYITNDKNILPYDGKSNPNKNPSYEKLSNADNFWLRKW